VKSQKQIQWSRNVPPTSPPPTHINTHKWQNRHLSPGALLSDWPTNSMEPSTTREATSCAATVEHPKMLWKPSVYYRINKRQSLMLILIQNNPVHITPNLLFKIIIILFIHLCLGLLSGSFLLAFQQITCVLLSPSLILATWHSHPSSLTRSS
jgi:hypothetical protein